MKSSALQNKSYAFAIRVVKMFQFLSADKREFVLSKQALRSGTSVGANIAEAGYAQSKADFIAKLSVAAKEAHETQFWLRLLHDTSYLDTRMYDSLQKDLSEVLRLLTASLKTAKSTP